jgi:hypothetical protein
MSTDRTTRRNLHFEYVSPEYEWHQFEVAGLTLRIGSRAWCLGTLDYREKNPAWPRWLRFRLVLGGLRSDGSRFWALYLFGRRIFNTQYWNQS